MLTRIFHILTWYGREVVITIVVVVLSTYHQANITFYVGIINGLLTYPTLSIHIYIHCQAVDGSCRSSDGRCIPAVTIQGHWRQLTILDSLPPIEIQAIRKIHIADLIFLDANSVFINNRFWQCNTFIHFQLIASITIVVDI